MYMPRISLYRPEKTLDYEFIDKQILEMFTVGGTDINVHKYLGPKNTSETNATADQPHYDAVKETNIQDMLFLENRDRKYDPDIYNMRAIYNVQDIDFDLSQFGLFLTNDTLFMTVHINSSVKTMGRKLMPGDVLYTFDGKPIHPSTIPGFGCLGNDDSGWDLFSTHLNRIPNIWCTSIQTNPSQHHPNTYMQCGMTYGTRKNCDCHPKTIPGYEKHVPRHANVNLEFY